MARGSGGYLLDHDGVALTASPVVTVDDGRVRRAQAMAGDTEVGLDIARQLLTLLFTGRAQLARGQLGKGDVGDALVESVDRLDAANDTKALRILEATAADLWWSSWSDVQMRFIAKDRGRVRDAWTGWHGRSSALGGARSPRHAVGPVNALLNYGYRLAEAETLLAVQAVGLDPTLGFNHTDEAGRNSLVLDLLEGMRPNVEHAVLQLLADRPFSKRDFAELPTGEVRLLAPVSHELAELLFPQLGREAAVLVEQLTRASPEARSLVELLIASPRDWSMQAAALWDKALQAVAGRSLKSERKQRWKVLDSLFQHRNGIVHRGEAKTPEEAKEVVAAAAEAGSWLDSVRESHGHTGITSAALPEDTPS
jgi:CRISPR-associated endonuclease Cas1